VLALRPYQAEALAAIRAAHAAGVRRPLVVLPTGAGKTVLFAHLIRERAGRSLVLAHRDEMIRQAADKLRQVDPRADVGIVQADRNEWARGVVVASVQSLAQPGRLARYRSGHFGTIVVDECFPAGTLIGDTPIEEIRPGDVVPSYDERTGMVVRRPVVRLFERKATALVTLRLVDGRSITCTPNHPLYTPVGWVPAGRLGRGMWVLTAVENGNADMLMVQRRRADHRETPQGHVSQDGAGLLLGRVPGQVGAPQCCGDDGGNQSALRQPADDRAQPDGAGRGAGEGQRLAAGEGLEAESAWGEWLRTNPAAARALRGAWLADGGGRRDEGAARAGLPDELQTGSGAPLAEGGDRGGRQLPSFTPRNRPEEGRFLAWTWVDRLEVHQPGSDGTFGGLCPGGLVYNFEVAGTHTYIAGGVVAHNCHHATARTYRTILGHLGALDAGTATLTVGVTATPDRGDGVGLGHVFERVAYERGLREMIAEGYLVPLRGIRVALDADFGRLRSRAGDVADADAARMLLAADAPQLVAAAYRRHAPGQRAICFTPTVAVAEACAAALVAAGVAAEALDGTTPPDERRAILARLREGATSVACNCGVLTEGFDEPRVACVIVARPTRSRGLYAQMVGRAARLYPGKSHATILDVVGSTREHQLVTLADLAGAAVKDDDGQAAASASTKGEGYQLGIPLDPASVGGTAVDLFSGRDFGWVPLGRAFVLPAGDGWVLIEPQPGDDDRWWVLAQRSREDLPELVEHSLDLGYAQGVAEDLVRNLGAAALANRDAPWRRRPASGGQLTALARWGVRPERALTMGEASDLLTATIAGATWERFRKGGGR